MVEGNGHSEEKVLKKCPFFQKWCDKELQDSCALHVVINKPMGGVMQQISMCGFNALGMLLSEINAKTFPPPQPQIRIPNIHRG